MDSELKSAVVPEVVPESQKEVKTSSPTGLLLLIILCVVLAVTNPTKPEYTTWVQEQVADKSMGQGQGQKGTIGTALAAGLVSLFGGPIIETVTTSNDYFFFTIFTTRVGGKEAKKVIGLFHHFIPIN